MALATAAALLGVVLVATPASAALTGASSTSTATVTGGTTTTLAGMSVTAAAGDSLSITVSTSVGTLTVNTGNRYSAGVRIYGDGVAGRVHRQRNAGQRGPRVYSTQYVGRVEGIERDDRDCCRRGNEQRCLQCGQRTLLRIRREPCNHLVERLDSGSHESYASQVGYLATVPSAGVNALITSKIPGALNVWLGGQSIANYGGYARSWQWMDGPLAGTEFTRCSSASGTCDYVDSGAFYQNWSTGEPNNWSNSEDYIVTNWNEPERALERPGR